MSREGVSGGGESPYTARTPGPAARMLYVWIPLAVVAANGNPIGLIVNGAIKVHGEESGSATIEGAAKRTADKIAEQMRPTIERQGWTA